MPTSPLYTRARRASCKLPTVAISKAKLTAVLAGGLLLAGGFLYARYVEPVNVEVRRLSLTLPRLPKEFNGYRLVHVSDLHADRWMTPARLSSAVDRINAEAPDLVAITGDFVTRSLFYSTGHFAPPLAGALSRLQAHDGVVAVLGNHDHSVGAEAVRQPLPRAGIRELANEVYAVRRAGAAMHVAGVDDHKKGLDRLDLVLEELEEGAAILLAHEPDFADQSSKSGSFDLQLSGHSHGGQIRLPLVGPVFLPPLSRKYPAGLYRVGDMFQYTNRGLGVAHLRLRFLCRPEITVLTFRAPLPDP